LILLFLHLSGERPRDVFLGNRSIAWEWSIGIALVPMAFVVIASMPVILMFGLVQKWFISGLTAGAVKG